jgi:hypothetical protein
MIKKITLIILLGMCYGGAFAQIEDPVKWSYAAKGTAVLLFKATIAPGWHIYSAYQEDGGPIKTSIVLAAKSGLTLLGKVTEPKPITKYEKVFEMNVHYFEKEVIFQQKISAKPGTIAKGSVAYMTCNDEKCLPPTTIDFSIPIK